MAAEIVSLPRLRDAGSVVFWARSLVETLQRIFTGQVSGIQVDIHGLKAGATTWDIKQAVYTPAVALPDKQWITVVSTTIDLSQLTQGEQSGVVVQAYSDITTYVNTTNGMIMTTALFIDNNQVATQSQLFPQVALYTLAQGCMLFLDPGIHTLDLRINANWNGNTGGIVQAERSRVMFTALR